MADPILLLRDIHQPVAPPWWPPAPAWWWLAAALLLLAAAISYFVRRRRQRRRAITALFDQAVDAAPTPSAQVAAMSELLRRAARRRDAQADRLQGDAWLTFLDAGSKQPEFSNDVGRLLLDGGYRREVDADHVAALRAIARARFLDWMAVK